MHALKPLFACLSLLTATTCLAAIPISPLTAPFYHQPPTPSSPRVPEPSPIGIQILNPGTTPISTQPDTTPSFFSQPTLPSFFPRIEAWWTYIPSTLLSDLEPPLLIVQPTNFPSPQPPPAIRILQPNTIRATYTNAGIPPIGAIDTHQVPPPPSLHPFPFNTLATQL